LIDLAVKSKYSNTKKLQPQAIDRFREERNDSFYMKIIQDKQLSQLTDYLIQSKASGQSSQKVFVWS